MNVMNLYKMCENESEYACFMLCALNHVLCKHVTYELCYVYNIACVMLYVMLHYIMLCVQ